MFALEITRSRRLSTNEHYITRRKLRARFGDISEMTLWRWERDENLAFPKALTINGRKYYSLDEIGAWERTHLGGKERLTKRR